MTKGRWLTPSNTPAARHWVRRLIIPADFDYVAIVNGALLDLTYSYNYEQFGTATPQECADAFSLMYNEYVKQAEDAPFWEDEEDVDTPVQQPWYEDLADWIIEGFLAISGFPQAAIIYSTSVPKIRFAVRQHDLGALVRVLLNNLEIYTGDTYSPIKKLFGQTLDLASFAADNGLGDPPWTLKIVHDGAGPNLPEGENGTIQIVRKRLTDEIPMIFRQTDPCLLEYSDDDGATWHTAADLSLCAGSGVPTGAMFPMATSTVPSGYLLCDGSLISRTTYAALFAVVGTTWGNGDGSTTFALPDTLGRTIVGSGSGSGSGLTNRTIGDKDGEETHLLTISEMPSHDHNYQPSGTGSSRAIVQFSGANGADVANPGVSTFSRGLNGSHNNMQPFIAAPYIIKT